MKKNETVTIKIEDIGVNGEVLFIVGIHHNVLTETVYHHIRQAVGEPYFYLLDFAGEHSEHPQRTLRSQRAAPDRSPPSEISCLIFLKK